MDFVELVSTGPFGSMLHKSDYVSNGAPLVNPTNIVDESIVPDRDKQVGDEALSRLGSYVLKVGDVVVGRRGEIGRCAVVGESEAGWICGTGCFFIRPKNGTDANFLARLLRSPEYRNQLERVSTGATMKNISNTALAQLPVALPALPEQRRIVSILDEAFEGIATAKVNAEKNLRNAREVFEGQLQAVFTRRVPGVPDTALEGVCDINSKLVDPRDDQFLDLPHVGAGNIEAKTGALIDVMTAREEQLISGKFLFDEAAVLYSKIRPYLIKVVRPEFSGLCSADIYPLTPKQGLIDRDYLYYLLISPVFTEYAVEGSARAGMPKVNREHLFAFRFVLPPISEQKRIAANLDSLAEKVRSFDSIVRNKLSALEELKQSLLHQAFSGAL